MRVTAADGSRTITIRGLNPDGSENEKLIVTSNASSTIQSDFNGDGVFDDTETYVVTIHGDGSQTETVSSRANNNVLNNGMSSSRVPMAARRSFGVTPTERAPST